MMYNFQQVIHVQTIHKGLSDITLDVENVVKDSKISCGICNIFVKHTSASLVIQENTDHRVLDDLNSFLDRIVPEKGFNYTHTIEGPDDMPSHIRSALTSSSEQIPINNGVLLLGIWQAIYLWEHKNKGKQRNVVIHIFGK